MTANAPRNMIFNGDCIDVMHAFDTGSIDFILTDPPYVTRYRDRQGRSVANDDNGRWLKPAFAEMHRVLKGGGFAVSFYGWSKVDLFMEAWRAAGFRIVGHLVFRKRYASSSRFLRYEHEQAHLLAKGNPRMAIIKTERNVVYAYDPEPGDAFVEVTWHGPPDEGSTHLRAFGSRPQPVEQYQACVDWAVSMADAMAYPLHVVTTPADGLLTAERLDRAYASMTGRERGGLANTIAAQVLRDCDDISVRQAAYAVLAKTGVVDE